ncbi:hypothetical protein AOLI_G00263140 [Acnodon oligacanthus]
MPKNKGKGGKNRRRGKNENESEKRELVFKEDGQELQRRIRRCCNAIKYRLRAAAAAGEQKGVQNEGSDTALSFTQR